MITADIPGGLTLGRYTVIVGTSASSAPCAPGAGPDQSGMTWPSCIGSGDCWAMTDAATTTEARRIGRTAIVIALPRSLETLHHLRHPVANHDIPAQCGLLGDEHARHAAAEFALERVAPAQGRLEVVAQVRGRQSGLRG